MFPSTNRPCSAPSGSFSSLSSRQGSTASFSAIWRRSRPMEFRNRFFTWRERPSGTTSPLACLALRPCSPRTSGLFGKVYFPRLAVPITTAITKLYTFGIQLVLFIIIYVAYVARGAAMAPNLFLLFLPLIVAHTALPRPRGWPVGQRINSKVSGPRPARFLWRLAVDVGNSHRLSAFPRSGKVPFSGLSQPSSAHCGSFPPWVHGCRKPACSPLPFKHGDHCRPAVCRTSVVPPCRANVCGRCLMNDIVIRVERLSKKYQLGTIGYGSLRHDLEAWWAKLRGKEDPNATVDKEDRLTNTVTSGRLKTLTSALSTGTASELSGGMAPGNPRCSRFSLKSPRQPKEW